jgi:hypothetical protein
MIWHVPLLSSAEQQFDMGSCLKKHFVLKIETVRTKHAQEGKGKQGRRAGEWF